MRVFILPSWCPTVDEPLSGAFFVEQAHVLAHLRPDWTVAICKFDLARSRVPWQLSQSPRFLKDWLWASRMACTQAKSGLYEYQVWGPYLPSFGHESKWIANVSGLAAQAKLALDNFIGRFGKPDLIHAHAVYPGGSAAVALGKALGIAVGLTEHLGPFPPATLLRSDGEVMPLITDTYSGASLCSAVSRSLADRIIALGLTENVQVLPNFLSDNFGMQFRKGKEPAKGRFKFLSVGGPSHAKGTDTLLRAIARLPSNVCLSLAGDSPEQLKFKKLAAELGLVERVCWLGNVPRDQISKHYKDCDAFVLPSRGETFGIAFIEALAFGKPLIATRCGGPEDIVNAYNGKLVPTDDVGALVAAMLDIVAQPERYDPHKLRLEFLKNFSGSAMQTRIEQWYKAVINANKNQAAN